MAEIIAANMTANTYDFFPASSLYPAGWLLCQLRTEAEGLAGHLDLIWPDVRDSKWIGGDREGWEETPGNERGGIDVSWAFHTKAADIEKEAPQKFIDSLIDELFINGEPLYVEDLEAITEKYQ